MLRLTLLSLVLWNALVPVSAQEHGMTVQAAVQVLFNRYVSTGPTGGLVSLCHTRPDSPWGWGIDLGMIGGREEFMGRTTVGHPGGSITNTYAYRSTLRMVHMDIRGSARLTPAHWMYSLSLSGGPGMGFVDFEYPRLVTLDAGVIEDIDQRRLQHIFPMIVTSMDHKLQITEHLHLAVRFHFSWGLLRSPSIILESVNRLPGGFSRGITELGDQERWHGFSLGGGIRF